MPPKDGAFHYFTEGELTTLLTDFGIFVQRSMGIAIAQSFGSVEPFTAQAIMSLLSVNLAREYPDITEAIRDAVTTLVKGLEEE